MFSATVRAALDDAAARLAAAGCETPRLDAEVLLASVLGTSRAAIVADGRRALGAGAAAAFQERIARRARREPVAYITGVKGFRALELRVDARVLVPRPETEHLVEAALALPRGARVVDVGTGSGAVALALKDERPDIDVSATDVEPGAAAVARANAARLGLDVPVLVGDLLAPVDGPIDAVVSNPPYIADADRATLPPDVVAHEPAAALFGGGDGLATIRRLVAQADERGARFVALEVAQGQAGAVAALVRAHGFGDVAVTRDLAGVERVVRGRR